MTFKSVNESFILLYWYANSLCLLGVVLPWSYFATINTYTDIFIQNGWRWLLNTFFSEACWDRVKKYLLRNVLNQLCHLDHQSEMIQNNICILGCLNLNRKCVIWFLILVSESTLTVQIFHLFVGWFWVFVSFLSVTYFSFNSKGSSP